MLCSVCQDIFTSKAPATATVSPFAKFTEYISFTRAHHRSLETFLESARQKCYVCFLLLERACEAYGFHGPRFAIQDSDEGFSEVSIGATRSTTDAAEQNVPIISISVSILNNAFEEQRKTDIGIELRIWPRQESSMPNETIARDISAAREENRKDQGQKWFRECSSTHDCDQHRDTKFRPTRLVEVVWGSRNSPQWRIVQANECPEVHQHEYATLSHRWPSQGMVSLVQDNLLSFKLPQAQEKLPDRWQQALDMARVLQLRYIWIDSLCIIQDSVEDWRRESLTMNKIYKNSTLTFLLTTPPYETLPLVNTPYSARFMRCFIQLDLMRWLEG